nr:CRAL-TRIO domain-containing protein YKL091C-like [Tanacetum cinerariifolium]
MRVVVVLEFGSMRVWSAISLEICADYDGDKKMGDLKLLYGAYIAKALSSVILFVENKQLKLTLVKDIDENQLPEVDRCNMKWLPSKVINVCNIKED